MKYLYWLRQWGKMIFLITAFAMVGIFILYSYRLTRDLATQERERMALWADATHQLIDPDDNALNFPLEVIERNTSIPVILTDADDHVLLYRNIEQADSASLARAIENVRRQGNRIDVEFNNGVVQHIYYEDSTLLKRLTHYPWIELTIIIAFLIIAYLGFNATKKMEQNRVWVGLSKETAHQLGTPISSLMGWLEYLRGMGVEPRAVEEMTRDVERLTDVSARFSKIGSKPQFVLTPVDVTVDRAVEYMRKRVAGKVKISMTIKPGDYTTFVSEHLLQWVMENLIKNAVDAIQGKGKIDITMECTAHHIYIYVKDNGKGIARKKWKRVFEPGFTTKKRGWGLGLTLTKRIVEEYHHGKIEITESVIDLGTTFRIELPKISAI